MLKPAQPITWLSAAVGNGQNLHIATDFAVDELKLKNLEQGATKIRRMNDA